MKRRGAVANIKQRRRIVASRKETRDVRVLPDGGRGKWKVTVDGTQISGHRTKRTAVAQGMKEGQKGGIPSELRIHKLDGKIQEERTYNKPDPYPPKG
jgi:hypothetical protein